MTASEHRHRVVVIGGGFAGLQTVRALRRARVDVTQLRRAKTLASGVLEVTYTPASA